MCSMSLNGELIKLFLEKELRKQNYLKPNIIRGGFLRNKKDHLRSEAQSELDKQELRVECAHRALHEASMQLHSQRKELHQANHLSDQSQREKSWWCTELDRRARVHQEDRMMSPQGTEELAKMCCTEAERATQLIIHELSIQEEESKSTVNQLMVPTSGTTKTRWLPWAVPEISLILKRQAVLGHPTFPVSLWVLRVLMEW